MANLKLDNSLARNVVNVTPDIEFEQDDLNVILELTRSYDDRAFLITASLSANPKSYSGYLYYIITGSALPEYEGQYIARTRQNELSGDIWNLVTQSFDSASFNWDDATSFAPGKTYSTDYAYVEGTDSLTIKRYQP